ncbi:unnamed protein product [Ascophyllum nodosum]
MVGHASVIGNNTTLRKESLAALSSLGFCDPKPRIDPHKYHGVAARMRTSLAIAGKAMAMATAAEQRRRHHKERITIQQVNDLVDISRDIDSFARDGRRVPIAVWEKYERVNERHKIDSGNEAFKATGDDRRQRESGGGGGGGDSWARIRLRSSRQLITKRPREGRWGTGCTFGSGKKWNGREEEALFFGGVHHLPRSLSRAHSCPSSSWGRYEREKLNELYWEIGRPPRRGVGAAREHFHRYSQRHCMLFPHRSPKEVEKRLKVMFRCNAMKEPNEREHWLNLSVSKGHFPMFGGSIVASAVGGVSTSAALYPEEARSADANVSLRRHSDASVVSPFYNPTRPSAPAWRFGETSNRCSGSEGGTLCNSVGSRGGSFVDGPRGLPWASSGCARKLTQTAFMLPAPKTKNATGLARRGC